MKNLGFSEKNNFKISGIKLRILFMILFFIGFNSFGQTVFELSSKLAEMKSSGDTAITNEASRIEKLIYDLCPTIYIENRTIKTFGETPPVCLKTDVGSIIKLKESNPVYTNIELLTIKFSAPADLIFPLDLSLLTGFTNLKYVQFVCPFNCTVSAIEQNFKPKQGVTAFYILSIPE